MFCESVLPFSINYFSIYAVHCIKNKSFCCLIEYYLCKETKFVYPFILLDTHVTSDLEISHTQFL